MSPLGEPEWLSVLSEARQAELRRENASVPGFFEWMNANPQVEVMIVLIRELRALTQELRSHTGK